MATRTAATGNLTDVQTTLSQCSDGDTLIIPSGTWTWSSGLTCAKNITLSGQSQWTGGASQQGPFYPSGAINFTQRLLASDPGTSAGTPIPLSGGTIIQNSCNGGNLITFTGSGNAAVHPAVTMLAFTDSAAGASTVHLLMQATPQPLISNCYFETKGAGVFRSIDMQSSAGGVIWNNLFWSQQHDNSGIRINTNSPNWESNDTIGTNDTGGLTNVYIENNIFIDIYLQNLDPDQGSRVVFRYNSMINSCSASHGQDTGPQGTRHWEYYNNRMTWNIGNNNPAGGSGSGFSAYPLGATYRFFVRGGTGVFTANQVDEITSAAFPHKTTVSLTAENINRIPNNIPCQTSYPAARQPGWGRSTTGGGIPWPTSGTSTNTGGPDGVNNVLDPIAVWNNTGTAFTNPGANQVGPSQYTSDDCHNGQAIGTYIQSGREWITTARPGWTPFTYPHPLTGSGGPTVPQTPNLVLNVSVPSPIAQTNFFVVTGSANSNSAPYLNAQKSGNTNLVYVWTSSISQTVRGVVDTAGNVYTPIFSSPIDPTGAWQLVIFMCNGIVASPANNTVTASLSAVTWSEMIILEYGQIVTNTPLDATSDSQGSGTLGTSSITTTGQGSDVVISWAGYGFPTTPTTTPSGFTLQQSTAGQTGTANLADLVALSSSAFSPAWNFGVSKTWEVTNLALKSTVGQPVLSSVPLTWTDPDATITTYHVKYGTTNGGPYSVVVNVGNVTSYTQSGLNPGTYYFVVSALNSVGESANSNQVVAVIGNVRPGPLSGTSGVSSSSVPRLTERPLLTRF